MNAELRCGNCHHLIGKNVLAGEFKCSKCGTFIVVQCSEFMRVQWHPEYNPVTVDNKLAT